MELELADNVSGKHTGHGLNVKDMYTIDEHESFSLFNDWALLSQLPDTDAEWAGMSSFASSSKSSKNGAPKTDSPNSAHGLDCL